MDPTTTWCPHLACPAKENRAGQYRHPFAERQAVYLYQCRKTFTATFGTVFYRLRTSADPAVLVVTLLAHGCC